MKKSLFFQTVFLIFIGMSLLNSGCGTLEQLFEGEPRPSAAYTPADDAPKPVRFSESPSVLPSANRQYRKMTRSRMEEESELGSQAGSMWNGEGQGAYLFAQNKSRREGDLLNVKMEGAAQKQVETKVGVIKKLLKQLEEEEARANGVEIPPAADNNANPKKPEGRAPASEASKAAEKEEPLDIANVPTRIVERQPDGNYRVKGSQPFMIGKREYKVIVMGMIRPEDFNDDGVSSNKLLDPQFDVVSLRRSQQ